MGGAIEGLTSKLAHAAEEHGALWGKIGKAAEVAAIAVAAVSIGAVTLGGAAVKSAADFEQQLEMIHTQAGASQGEVDALRDKVLALAPAVGIGPTQLAEGLYHVESAGFRGAQALDMVTRAAQLAQVGQSNLEDTTQAVIGVMAAWPDIAGGAAGAVAQLNAIVGTGDMRMQGLAAAMSTGILPAAATFHLGLTDVGAALATLTDNVTPPEEAATRLRMTFALLGAPSHAAAKALEAVGMGAKEANDALANRQMLEKYGISVTKLADDLQQPDGLLVAIGDLRTHLQGAGLDAAEQAAVISKAFGGGRTSAGIMTLITEFDRFSSKYPAIREGASQFGEAWDRTERQFNISIDRIKAGAQSLLISLGEQLLPKVTPVMDAVSDVLSGKKSIGQGLMSGLVGAGMKPQDAAKIAGPVGFALMDMATQAGPALRQLAQSLGQIGQALLPLIPPALELARTMLGMLVPALQAIGSHMNIIKPVLGALVGIWLGWVTVSTAAAAIAWAQTAGIYAYVAATYVMRAAQIAATVVQWAWNVAMTANPIGLVIIGIAALIGIVILLVTHWKQVTDALHWFWQKIVQAAATITQFIEHHRVLAVVILGLTGPIGFLIAAVAMLITHWDQVKQAVGEAFNELGRFGDWLRNTFGPILYGIGDAIGGIASGLANMPGIGGLESALGISRHALGGHYEAGTLSIVGESGPELFASRSSGTIIPADQTAAMLGGGSTDMTDTNELLVAIHARLASIDRALQAPAFSTRAYGQA